VIYLLSLTAIAVATADPETCLVDFSSSLVSEFNKQPQDQKMHDVMGECLKNTPVMVSATKMALLAARDFSGEVEKNPSMIFTTFKVLGEVSKDILVTLLKC